MNRISVNVRIALIVALVAGAYGVIPAAASAGENRLGPGVSNADDNVKFGSKTTNPLHLKVRSTGNEEENKSPSSLEDNPSRIRISAPLIPVGMNPGESKLVPYSIADSDVTSGRITSRTFQFFTQYDVPLSESFGPFPANISINSTGTSDWNELVYLPAAVADRAHAIKDYALVLKTNFDGVSQTGAKFSAEASLLILLPPADFSKASPANGTVVSPGSQSLQWDSSLGAVDYEYCFDIINNNSCDTSWTGTYWLGTYDTNAALQNLPPNTTFYWQVRANNTAGTTYANNGVWWEFTTATSASAGSLDVTFDGDGLVTTSLGDMEDAQAIAIQSDGKIVVAGAISGSSTLDFLVIRYNSDGSLDFSFDSDGIVTVDFGETEGALGVAIQDDGKIVVAGYSDPPSGDTKFALARINPDGTLDATFDTDAKVISDLGTGYDYLSNVAIQDDGKIIAIGSKNVGTNDDDIALARYNSDGSLDTTFDSDGIVITPIGDGSDYPYSIVFQSDGRIIVGGGTETTSGVDFFLVRYDSDGSLDASFDNDGIVITDIAEYDSGGHVALQSDGKS